MGINVFDSVGVEALSGDRIFTTGNFTTEADACARLDDILLGSGLFLIHREIDGYYTQPRVGQDRKDPRIDRILVPTRKLLDIGWQHGFFGIEVKRSGEKANYAIAQMLDYQRAVWTLPKGYKIVIGYCFLWHLEKQRGFVASLFAQQRLGSAYSTNYCDLTLASGEVVLLRLNGNSAEVCGQETGNRAGSR